MSKPKIFMPYLLLLFCQMPPQLSGLFYYIILTNGGWNIGLLAFNDLIVGLLFSFGFLYYLNRYKSAPFYKLMIAGMVIVSASFFMYSVYLFIDVMPIAVMFFYRIILFISQSVGTNLLNVPVIGNISKVLPEGFESTGINVAISMLDTMDITNQKFSSWQINAFRCYEGYYEKRTQGPWVMNMWWWIGLILLSPLFLIWG